MNTISYSELNLNPFRGAVIRNMELGNSNKPKKKFRGFLLFSSSYFVQMK